MWDGVADGADHLAKGFEGSMYVKAIREVRKADWFTWTKDILIEQSGALGGTFWRRGWGWVARKFICGWVFHSNRLKGRS